MRRNVNNEASKDSLNYEYMKHILNADERSNRKKILAVSTQLKQLRKESLKEPFLFATD